MFATTADHWVGMDIVYKNFSRISIVQIRRLSDIFQKAFKEELQKEAYQTIPSRRTLEYIKLS